MITLENKARMLDLIEKLNDATTAYEKGHPYMSDKEWDDMYFELYRLEDEAGESLPDSPTSTIHYTVVNSLKKVEHNHLMLSLDKTKDIMDILSFVDNKQWIAMPKLDGLTCSLRYLNGRLVSAETRGNGRVGEDITHNAMVIPSIPKRIDFEDELVVDGEIICTYDTFKEFENDYANPRNFASGSIRLLDSKECAKRKLLFVAWDVIKGGYYDYLSSNLASLASKGFLTVLNCSLSDDPSFAITDVIEEIKDRAAYLNYPIDGIVFKYDLNADYLAAGKTDHHFKGGLAYKFYDETYSTRLRHISWTMGRTGVLTPVAVFDPINIDGTEVSRASLHNVSVMHELLGDCAYVGEPLEIYKANQIIPQVYSAGPKYNYGEVLAKAGSPANDAIEFCPICGSPVSYKEENNIIRVYCENNSCSGQLINRLDHFLGKKGLDIKGLSEMTLEKLVDWGWINCLSDVFKLQEHKEEWINKLIERHNANLEYERTNPPVWYDGKPKKGGKRKPKAKEGDMFPEETKKAKISKAEARLKTKLLGASFGFGGFKINNNKKE